MESVYAAFKASLVPLNVNYRYQAEELRYLLDNSDAEIVVVHEDFAPLLEEVLPDLPQVVRRPRRGRGGEYDVSRPLPAPRSTKPSRRTDRPAADVERSPDDLLFVYTGGTTGMPKGVMWRQGDLFTRFGGGGIGPTPETESRGLPRVREGARHALPLPHQPAADARHRLVSGDDRLARRRCRGGPAENAKKFDAGRAAGARWMPNKINSITIVGDPFAKPMVKELEANTVTQYDISSVVMIASSGVMWSQETKQRLLAHHSG